MNPDDLASNIEDIILKAVGAFNEGLEKSQTTAYSKMTQLIKELKLDSRGNIKKTSDNVKILRKISKSIEDTLLTPSYKKRVADYLKSFDAIEAAQTTYFSVIKAGFETPAMLEVLKERAIESTISSLTETGLNQAFTQPIKDILYRNIATGGSYSSFQEELRTFIVGTDEVDGAFLRYTKQVTNDSVAVYNRSYSESVSKDLGLVFYKYTGTEKDTTREFCRERKNKYYHIEEIKGWGSGEKCCGLKFPTLKDGKPYWPGMIKGTNESNILEFAGGYLCMHQMVAVSQAVVPKDVVERAKEKGFL